MAASILICICPKCVQYFNVLYFVCVNNVNYACRYDLDFKRFFMLTELPVDFFGEVFFL